MTRVDAHRSPIGGHWRLAPAPAFGRAKSGVGAEVEKNCAKRGLLGRTQQGERLEARQTDKRIAHVRAVRAVGHRVDRWPDRRTLWVETLPAA